jgi:predicted CoA-binding protein
MPSDREKFFELESFAVIGNTSLKAFPKLTYQNLRKLGKTVYPIDLGGKEEIEGDKAFGSVADLPGPVQGAVVEVPKDTVMDPISQVAEAGIQDLWLHMKSDTPEALAFCEEKGIRVRYGTCAVMYTHQGFSVHSIHKGIMKLFRKY